MTTEEMRAFLESLSFRPGRPGMRMERNIPLPTDIPPVWQHLIKTTPIDPEGKKGPQFDPDLVPIMQAPSQRYYEPMFSPKDDAHLLAQSSDNKLLEWMAANQVPDRRDAGDNKGALV